MQGNLLDLGLGMVLATAVFAVIVLVLIMPADAAFLHKHAGGCTISRLSKRVNSGSGTYHFTGEGPATCAAILAFMFFAAKKSHDIHLPFFIGLWGQLIVTGKLNLINIYISSNAQIINSTLLKKQTNLNRAA